MTRLLVLLISIISLAACSSSNEIARLVTDPPAELRSSIQLVDVPFFPQEDYQCGPAALATSLVYSGVNVTVDELVDQVYIPARRGSLQIEMLAATRGHGRLPYLIDPNLESLLAEVAAGRPVLVFQNLGLDWIPQWHYAVVVGFNLDQSTVTLRSGTIKEYTISLSTFARTWRRTDNWGFVSLEPGQLPVNPDSIRYFEGLLAMEQVVDYGYLIPAYRSAILHWQETPLFLMGLGNLFYQQGELEEAEAQYALVTNTFPDYAEGHNNRAQALLELGDLGKAEIHARKAVELGGARVDLYRNTLSEIVK